MNCRLPKKIGTPGGGASYPEGAFIPVTKFTAGKSYALVAKIDGVYRYINTEKFNDYTLNATEVSVTPGGGYVTFGSEPALFKAEASGDGFTLSNGDNYLYGYSDQYSTALRYDASSSVWTVDTSETGGFDSGKYLPKEVSSSVWLKNASGDYEWSIKYESANASFGYDRAGRDSTYSTGFVSFILYEKWEGQTGGGDSGGDNGGLALTIKEGSMGWPSGALTITANGTDYTEPTTLALASGTEITVKLGTNTSSITIWHNGVRVDNGAATERTYTFTLTEDTTIGAIESDIKVVITGSESSGGTTPSEYAVTLSGSFNSSYGYVTINGTKYTSAQTVTVTAGTEISVYVAAQYSYMNEFAKVTLNGTTVQSGSGTYAHTVNSNCTISMGSLEYAYQATITTE